MVGHDDRDGVDIRPGQEFTKINVGVAALELAAAGLLGVMLVDPLLRGFPAEDLVGIVVADAASIHVADGQHLHVVVDQERRHNPLALVPAADQAHVDPIAWRLAPSTAKERRRQRKPPPWTRPPFFRKCRRVVAPSFGVLLLGAGIASPYGIHFPHLLTSQPESPAAGCARGGRRSWYTVLTADDHPPVVAQRLARVGVEVEPREVAAGDVDPNAVSLLEHVRRRVELDRQLVDRRPAPSASRT